MEKMKLDYARRDRNQPQAPRGPLAESGLIAVGCAGIAFGVVGTWFLGVPFVGLAIGGPFCAIAALLFLAGSIASFIRLLQPGRNRWLASTSLALNFGGLLLFLLCLRAVVAALSYRAPGG